MTLREWLEGPTGMPVQEFARQVGEPVALVRSWVSGRIKPTPVQRMHVSSVTKGKVTTWN